MGNIKAIVLAAGKGTRMCSENSEFPKVMRSVLGKPLLYYVLNSLSFIATADTVIVVGYKKEKVIEAFGSYVFAEQKEQLGTGHAVMSAKEKFDGFDGSVLVCNGDMPLLKKETYLALCAEHEQSGAACTVLTGTSKLPLPYGRVVRDENGDFAYVVEDRDCNEQQKLIDELNSGVYIFKASKLFKALEQLKTDNSQSEYYLTDVPGILLVSGEKVGVCKRELGVQLIGVNTPQQLAEVEQMLKQE